jgi:DNA polymerase III epsilon subunit-like protein
MGFITKYMVQKQIRKQWEVFDTVSFSRKCFPTESRHNLDLICGRLGLTYEKADRHRSMTDVLLTAKAFVMMRDKLGDNCPSSEKWTI